MLKSYGWWWVVGGGLEQFSVSPRPFGFGFGAKGLGPGLDKKGKLLTDRIYCSLCPKIFKYSFSPSALMDQDHLNSCTTRMP